MVRNVVVLKYVSVCAVYLYQQRRREVKLLFQQWFVFLETFRTMPDWFYITIVCVDLEWLRHDCRWHCCVIGLHICTWTFTLWFNLGNPQRVSVPIHTNCWRVTWTMGFWCSICRACIWYFCFAIGAECSVADSYISVCFVILPAMMTWHHVAISTAILFAGERFAQCLIGSTLLLYVVVKFD
jgi:hypothetical protein